MVQTLACTLLAVAAFAAEPSTETTPQSPFKERGYYITFMRMPTYDLADWKRIVDGIHDDGGNLLLALDGRGIPFPEVPDHLEVQRGTPERPPRLRSRPDRPCPRPGHPGASGFHAIRLRRGEPLPAGTPGTEGDRQGREAGRQVRHRLLGLQSLSLQARVPAIHAGLRSGNVLRLLPERRWADDRVVGLRHLPLPGLRRAILREGVPLRPADFG